MTGKQEKAYCKAIRTIAESLVRMAREDDTSDDVDEFEHILDDYTADMMVDLNDEIENATKRIK